MRVVSKEDGHLCELPFRDMKKPYPSSFRDTLGYPPSTSSRCFFGFKVAGIHGILELGESLAKEVLPEP